VSREDGMLEINALELMTLGVWALGVIAGLWFFWSSRTLTSALILGMAVFLPVFGTVLAFIAAALHRFRLRRHEPSTTQAV
jgi:predicted PurR-regulated permease PerM